MSAFVYILASQRNGTLYVGVTTDLSRRLFEHQNKMQEGFTSKYGVSMLVYAEQHPTIEQAIQREKAIKKWRRAWKVELIETLNPDWVDISAEVV